MESKKQGPISIIMPGFTTAFPGSGMYRKHSAADGYELGASGAGRSFDRRDDELVLKLAEEDSRILPILRQKNGVSAARNEGLEKAQGEFIMFVDADDKLDPQMLSVLRTMLGQTESDLAVCDYYRWNG